MYLEKKKLFFTYLFSSVFASILHFPPLTLVINKVDLFLQESIKHGFIFPKTESSF